MHTPPFFQTHTNTSYTHAYMIQSFRHSFSLVFCCVCVVFFLCAHLHFFFFDLVFNKKKIYLKKKKKFLSAQIDQGDRTEAKSSLVFPTATVVKVKDAETKRNKASVAHTGWKKRTKTSTTTPKKNPKRSACIQVACNYFFNRKFANQRAIVQQENHIHRVTGLVV